MPRAGDSSSDSRSLPDALSLYYDLVLRGEAPDIDAFCARYPDQPSLREHLIGVDSLRDELAGLYRSRGRPARSEVPRQLGDYHLLNELGAGGMGRVFLAQRRGAITPFALKVMRLQVSKSTERFEREIRLATRIRHPNVASVVDWGIADGFAYVVSEMVRGFPLRILLESGRRRGLEGADWVLDAIARVAPQSAFHGRSQQLGAWGTVIEIIAQLALGLAAAHTQGVVHRDIKPENVMLTFFGEVKLIDFGLAVAPAQLDDRFTATGVFVGSIDYAAPEQLRGDVEAIGPWTDVYALGVTVFELLTGQRPFRSTPLGETAGTAEPYIPAPSDLNPTVPPTLDALVSRALSPEPHERYPDAGAMASSLRRRQTLANALAAPLSHGPRNEGTQVVAVVHRRGLDWWRSAIRRNYPRLRALLRQIAPGEFLLAHVENPSASRAMRLRPPVGPTATAVVGRHTQAHFRLEGDMGVSLRHVLVRLVHLRDGIGARVLDLRTGQGFTIAGFGLAEAAFCSGPLFFAVGSHALVLLPGSSDRPPRDAGEGTEYLLDAAFDDRRLQSMSLMRTSMQQRPKTVTIIPGAATLEEAPIAEGRVAGELFIDPGGLEMNFEITEEQLRRGLLLGRYARCELDSRQFWDNDRVSRVHLLLLHDDAGLYAIDVASTNGSTRNGRRFFVTPLSDRDVLDMGQGNLLTWTTHLDDVT